ncbi:MAG: class I SAM-dependent methyltransferase [Ruminococcus flavefaciens]|nr:class I SAM-dependent methyltransferase [Ruminococcus flavefaciens]
MDNKWKEIWNKKGGNFDQLFLKEDEFDVYRELKRLDGYDVGVGEEELYYRNFYDSAVGLWECMSGEMEIASAYEVGCGSGADLYLLKNRDIEVGGIDYSVNLANIARKMVGEKCIETGEATDMKTDEKFDAVFSDGAFPYFSDEAYGEKVLEKMYEKARKAVIILEIFDRATKEECESHRRAMLDDYDEKYAGLDKTFYDREMFQRFAREHKCRIEFADVKNDQYWNGKYLFNCFLYKIH